MKPTRAFFIQSLRSHSDSDARASSLVYPKSHQCGSMTNITWLLRVRWGLLCRSNGESHYEYLDGSYFLAPCLPSNIASVIMGPRLENIANRQMANQAHQASFEDLPSELVLHIFSSINDLPTIDYLTLVSANACRVFNAYGPEILHRILTENGTVTPEIVFIMRRVALIRRSTPADTPEKTFDLFLKRHVTSRQQMYGRPSVRHREPACSTGKLSFRNLLRDGLDKECPAHAFSARELLVLARRTAIRAEKCLARARGRYLACSPAYPAEKICYGMMPWDERFEGQSITPPEGGGPFSWVEIQRMWRGFWRLQLLEEIKTAEAAGRLGWRKPRNSPLPLQSLEDRYLDWMSARNWGGQMHELRMAEDFVKTTGAERTDTAMLGNGMMWPSDIEMDLKLDPQYWLRHLKNHAPGWKICNRLTIAPGSPLKCIPMPEFRKLGVFIWDFNRLKSMDLLTSEFWPPCRFPLYGDGASMIVFTWRSYLDEDVLRAADSQAKEEWEAYRKEMRSKNGFDSDAFDIVGADWMRYVQQSTYGDRWERMEWIEKARDAVAATLPGQRK